MGRVQTNRRKARCPECLATIWVKDTIQLWDPVTCPECHSSLEVVSLHPLRLDYLEDEAFDDEDEWDDDER